jgi:glucokinase
VADVGATKTLVALGQLKGRTFHLHPNSVRRLSSRHFSHLADLLQRYLQELDNAQPRWACLGVPGPVKEGSCRTTNLPWELEEKALRAQLGLEKVVLVNDVAALAWAFAGEPAPRFQPLRKGTSWPASPLLVVSVGTGLGAAFLLAAPGSPQVVATEAGHSDFCPGGPEDFPLHQALVQEFGHASFERVVSGPGLVWLYRFFSRAGAPLPGVAEGDLPAHIVRSTAQDPVAKEAVLTLARYLGSFVGNLALCLLPGSGIYLAGSVSQALFSPSAPGENLEVFLAALENKGRQRQLLASLPVNLLVDPFSPLWGCGRLLGQQAP